MERRAAIKITLWCAGGTWIWLSDRLLISGSNFSHGNWVEWATYKGVGFVVVTTLLLYALLNRHLKNQGQIERELADISREHQLEKQLWHAQRMEVIGQVVGGIAHDFRNLLTGIMGFTQLLLEKAEPKSQAQGDLVQILELANRASRLTRDLLLFSRKESIHPVVLDLNQLIEATLRIFGRLVGRDFKIEFIPAAELGRVRVDPGQIEQALTNLILNARDAMTDGGTIVVQTEDVAVDAASPELHPGVKPGRYSVFHVKDSGCGMDSTTLERIFEPFFTTKEPGKGTGLGLSLVYGVIKAHDGYIHVRSVRSEGATFSIYLPQVEAELDQAAKSTSEIVPTGNEAVLVIDDEESIRLLAERALEGLGYTVYLAPNPKEAENRYAQEKIALVITDVVVPGTGIRRLLEQLKAQNPSVRVLYMSGYASKALLATTAGECFLPKPFTPTTLALKVREVLDHRL